MKKFYTYLTCLFIFLLLIGIEAKSQVNDYNCCIRNYTIVNATTIEFDVYVEWTGVNTQKFQFLQAGINFNYSGMANGGIITGQIKSGSPDPGLPTLQQAPNWNINQSSKQIRLIAAIATPSTIAVPIPAPPGFRIGTFVMTNTVPFISTSAPNFVWSFASGTGSTTQTKIGVYLNNATTGTEITDPTNHCVDISACTTCPSCPQALSGGPYSSCGDVHLNGSFSHATSATWSTSGSGTFDPDNATLNAVYHPSSADLSNGSITMTLTTDAGASGCTPSASVTTVTFIPIDDGIACTIDACDSNTGQVSHTPNGCTLTNSYNNCIENIRQTAPNVLEFDVMIEWTGTNNQLFQFLQAGIDFNYAGIANGGTITGSFKPGSAHPSLTGMQQNPNWQINQSSKQIRLLPAIALSPSNATQIPPPPGFRLGTFVMTNTVPFTSQSTPDFNWSFNVGSSSTTQTKVGVYLNGSSTGTDITVQSSHCVESNYALNRTDNTYKNCIQNIVQTSPTTMEFDVVIEWTGTNTQKFQFLQAGINFDYAGLANGGVITGSFKPGSADPSLPASQQTLNWNINQTSKQIRLLSAIATPASIATSIPPPPGFRLGTFVMTNTVPFSCNTTPDFQWSFTQGSSTTTQTKLAVYLNGSGTGTEITVPANHCVSGNTVINPNPAVTVTPGSIYCYGGTTCITVTATGGTAPYSGDGEQCGYGAGTYTFDVTDANGCVTTSDPVTITEPDKLELTGSSTPSNGNDGTATVNPTGGTPSYSYLWTPGNQTTTTATGLAPGNYCVIVIDLNGCTASYCVTVASTCNLNAPGPVTGPDGACKKQQGLVYCVPAHPFATSYTWTLPAGVTAQGSSTGPCITLKFSSKFKGGFICAKAVTPCGTSAASCKNVVLVNSKPATPGAISGPASLCLNEIATYSIAPVPTATSYEWKEDHLIILSGQGTTTVTVQAEPGFNGGKIKVRARNCKDRSGERTRNIAKTTGCRLSSDEVMTSNVSNNVSLTSINVYPNPTTGIASVTFTSNVNAEFTLRVSDLTGRVLLSEVHMMKKGFNTTDINLENLAKGIYQVSLTSEDGFIRNLPIIVE